MADEKAISVRSLIDSDIGPLRRFTGILDSMPQEEKIYDEGKPTAKSSTRINLNFKDLEVIESVEPYNFPITTIMLTLSNRKKSKFGVFGESLGKILDMQYNDAQRDPNSPEYVKPAERMDLPDCLGKRIGMVMADGEDGRPAMHLLFDGRAVDETHLKGQDMPTAVWEVYMIEGIGTAGEEGVTPLMKAMELLDGKKLSEFNQAALASDVIRGDQELLQSIGLPASAKNSFTATMLSSKQFTKDAGGVFHKVG
jgi:hypothetical protein